MIDLESLHTVNLEAAGLVERLESLSPTERRRLSYLTTAATGLREGHTLDEISAAELNVKRRASGLGPVSTRLTAEKRALAKWLKTGLVTVDGQEERAEVIGWVPFNTLNGGLGHFVPTQFFSDVRRTMATHSPLFDSENVTYQETDAGGLLEVPFFSDIENVAVPSAENIQDATDQNISEVGISIPNMVTFASPRTTYSIEAASDIENWLDRLADVLADRCARGIGKVLMNGYSGVAGTITGLLPAVIASGATMTAIGSSEVTGGAQTGVNSLGVSDFANTMTAMSNIYLNQPKFAILMNTATFGTLLRTISKMGDWAWENIIKFDPATGQPRMWGKKILIDESMPFIGSGNVPVLMGDFSYWLTRLANASSTDMQVYTEAPGLIEYGKACVRLRMRASGVYMFNDVAAYAPIWGIQNHS